MIAIVEQVVVMVMVMSEGDGDNLGGTLVLRFSVGTHPFFYFLRQQRLHLCPLLSLLLCRHLS